MDEDGAVCFLGCSKVLFESTAGELLLRAPQQPSGHIVQLLHCPSGSAGWGALILSGKQMHSLKHAQAAQGLLVLFPTVFLSSFLPQLPREPTASEAANLHSHLNWTFQHIPEELWMHFSLASAEELRGEQGTRSRAGTAAWPRQQLPRLGQSCLPTRSIFPAQGLVPKAVTAVQPFRAAGPCSSAPTLGWAKLPGNLLFLPAPSSCEYPAYKYQ